MITRKFFLIAALTVLGAVVLQANGPLSDDEKSFAAADWGWKALGNGAEVGYAQIELFGGSVQSISVLRYPMKKVATLLANDGGAEADSTSALALRHGGIAAINASYFNVKTLYPVTFVKDDGEVEGKTTSRETFRTDGILAIGKGGRKVKIFTCDTLSYLKRTKGFEEAIASGPVVMLKGKEARPEWPSGLKKPLGHFYNKRHPRTLVGTGGGMVYLIVIDGRFHGQGEGATIHECYEICRMLGLRDAINLDGGGSSVLWTKDFGAISHPYDNHRFDHFGQRVVPNIIYIK